MITEQVAQAVALAKELAETTFFNNIISIEHLSLALLITDKEVIEFFVHKNCDITGLKAAIANHIREEYPVVKIDEINPQPSMSYKRVLERAVFVAQYSNRTSVYGLDIIDAMFPERDSFITMLMSQSLDISREEVRHYCSKLHHGDEDDRDVINGLYRKRDDEAEDEEQDADSADDSENQDEQSKKIDKLKTNIPESIRDCLTSLSNLASAGKIEQVIGRNDEYNRIYEALGRRKKNNVIIVGNAGVGKTAIGEGIAFNIANGLVPEFLKDFQVYSLDISSAVAGTQFRGDYEKKLKEVVKFINKREKAILFIDEIHNLAQTSNNNSSDASSGANIIKGDLIRGNLHCIATTTFESYNLMFSKDATFTRRFTKIDIDEPSEADTLEILKAAKEPYEKFHNVIYPENVLERIIKLSVKYMHNRYLPDKAFDVLDVLGSFEKIKAQADGATDAVLLNEQHVTETFSRLLHMPIILKNNDNDIFRDLNSNLKKVVFGQDSAIDQICDAVIMNKSGLDNATRPIGAFLFAGPTGVGKTEIVVQLANLLSMHLIRLDMSEYSSEFTVSKLLGSPPGYVGYDHGGVLTNQVKNDPNSVVLFDEIEKAHPSIFNVLLQLMDNGIVTDSSGVKVNFRNTIVVLTTNCGASEMEKGSIGFTKNSSEAAANPAASDSLKQTFSPEFRNRLDGIVWFNNLSTEIVGMVFDKLWKELGKQLSEKNVTIEISASARDELIKRGYDRTMGARPMRRTLRDNIHKVLSRELLFGQLMHGGSVAVDYFDDRFDFRYRANPSPAEEEQIMDLKRVQSSEFEKQQIGLNSESAQ